MASTIARSLSVTCSRNCASTGSASAATGVLEGSASGRVGAEDGELLGRAAQLDQRLRDDRVERMAREHRVEAVLPWLARDRSRDELDEIDAVPRERFDRPVQRARPVVGDERER